MLDEAVDWSYWKAAMRIEPYLDDLARQGLKDTLGLSDAEIPRGGLRPTTDPKFGDYQINTAMQLAKVVGKPPREIAGPLAVEMAKHRVVQFAEVAGPGFVNLRLDDRWLSSQLTDCLREPGREGVPYVSHPERIVVDYSSPNIAKQMHVGHLRSTIIGDAIVRMLRFIGHTVIGDNHLGDWGTQFGLLLVGMRTWGSDQALAADPVVELERVYKLASERAKNDAEFAESARLELAKLQSGDAENRAMWERFVAATRNALDAIYARLGVSFDLWLGESAYHDRLPGIVSLLLERGIAREDQGAICVFWEDKADVVPELAKQKEPFIIRKKDGAFLYSTTDIATLVHRRDELRADRSVYVVDSRQGLHFQQLFAVARLLGIDLRLDHVGFGTVLGADGRPLRTRDGGTVTLASLLDEAEERARARIQEEGLEIPAESLADVSRAVGIGAVKYADLRQNRLTDYQFDWDKMISFKGNAGPYLQYAYARIRSIFRKGETDVNEVRKNARVRIGHEAECSLARALMRFPDVVHAAAETYQPHLVCEHLYNLARAFSTFYEACPVLRAEGEEKESRLALACLTAAQLERGLGFLGIETVERM